MRELDKSKVYDLSELTSGECKEFLTVLKEIDKYWDGTELEDFTNGLDDFKLKFFWDKKEWNWTKENSTHNAKELFYTIENIQVDCSELSKECILEMAKVFEDNGFETINTYNTGEQTYLMFFNGKVSVLLPNNSKSTITYEKFMELFGSKETTQKPTHYSKGIDTFARMEANCTKEECLAFAKGNIDKYNWRNKGQDVEDLKKIIQYANWALKIHENGKEK